MSDIGLTRSQTSPSRGDEAYWKARRRDRARDFGVVAAGIVALLSILAVTGGLGWVEAVTASVVVAAAMGAYFIATAPGLSASGAAADEVSNAPAAPRAEDMDDIIRSLPLPAMHVGAEGTLLAINEQAQSVFRTRATRGVILAGFIRSSDLLNGMEECLKTGEGRTVEFSTSGASEDIWLASITHRPGPEGEGVLVVFQERSSLRRAERARADFLANASHELRTPLTSLKGYIETLQGPARDDPDSWDRFLDIMSGQAARMERLISDLLSLSRIELSVHVPPDTAADFAEVARAAVEALLPVAQEKGVAIECEGPERLEILARPDEMTQVVQNFLSNAVKYTPEGGKVRVSFGEAETLEAARDQAGRRWPEAENMTLLNVREDQGGRGAWLRVEDDGPGIGREHLPRLSERFYRVDEGRGRSVGGIGLGLAIVKHIMTRHKGGMIVESLPGRGSAFGVWLPVLTEGAGVAE